jgi:hypothetical protein
MSNINTLENVVATSLKFSIWTGRKMLDEGDLSLNGEVPPREVINLGSKHTTDPKALKVFNTLKRRAERACLRVGIPFLGGYAIPADKADNLAKDLAKIAAEYEAEKQTYLAKHESIQDEWIAKFPKYETILRKALTPVDVVDQRIRASFSMYRISSTNVVTSVDAGLNHEVEDLTRTLDEDILKSANKLAESLSKAINPNQNNVNGLKQLREKVEGLAFLNNKFRTLVQVIRHTEDSLPVAGKLNPQDVNTLSGLLYRMSEPTRLAALMSNINSAAQEEPVSQSAPAVNTTQVSPGSEWDGELCDPEMESNASQPVEDELTSDDMYFDSSDFEFSFDDDPIIEEAEITESNPVMNESNPAMNATFF